ncbi:MAG: hypothetical protein ACUVWP_07615 [bacterium]
MPKKKSKDNEFFSKFNNVLSRLEERQNAFLDKSLNTFNIIYNNITGLDNNLNRMTRRFDSILNKAIGHSDLLLANFTELAQNAISIATRTFSSILQSALKGLGGGGLLGFLGSLLSFIPFFQEGGIIRGTQKGIPAIIGEKYTSEVILPIERLESLLSRSKSDSNAQIIIREGDINIDVKGSLTDLETIKEEIFKASMTGRMRAMERASGWIEIEGIKDGK